MKVGEATCKYSHLHGDGIIADCSSKSLGAVPVNLPSNLEVLILNNNNLEILRNGDFQECHRLITLTLSNNSLAKVEPLAFENTKNLEELDLRQNNLSFTHDSLPPGIFSSLSKLATLSIQKNQWCKSNQYPDWIFVGLRNLKTLSIDGVPNATFGSNFSQLSKLGSLTVYGGLNSITNETFQELSICPLEHLSIKTDKTLVNLEPMSFAHFRQLRVLDLGFNHELGIDGAARCFYGLQFTKISVLILSRIVADNQPGMEVRSTFYQQLKACVGLKKLLLDKNNIITFGDYFAVPLKHVEHLDLSYNRIAQAQTFIFEASKLKRLRFFDVSHQTKRYVEKRSIRTTPKPMNYGGSDNGEQKSISCETPRVKPCPIPLSTLPFGLDENGLRKGQIPLIDKGPWCMPLPPRLQTLNLSSSLNIDLRELPQLIIFGGPILREVVYKSNGLSLFRGPVIFTTPNPNIPLTFDLADNGFTCVAHNVLNYSLSFGLNLGKFQLSGNDLGAQLERDTEGKVFDLYRNLTELNLAKNNIKVLPRNVFIKLSKLEVLNVSRNSLGQIQFEFSHMELLKTLDIANNLITNLNSEVLDELVMLHEKSNLSINLFGNPIQCSCESVPFLRRIESNPRLFLDVASYSCLYRETFVTFDQLSFYILPDLFLRCSSHLFLVVSAVLFGITVIVLATSIFLFRHRWDIRYFCLRLTTQRKKAQPEPPKMFDAFVIYDRSDRDWVHDELLKNLEQEDESEPPIAEQHCERDHIIAEDESMEILDAANFADFSQPLNLNRAALKLCIHERDFPLGERIEENIIGSIENSRKIILVLSRSFCHSQWCCYELELAKIASLDRGRNLLVPVMLEDLDIRNMSRGLQSVLRNYTYIDWSENTYNRAEFWQRLRRALSEPSCVYVCECGRSVLGTALRNTDTDETRADNY